MSGRGALLSLGILALFLAVFVPLVLRVRSGRDMALDADRLRRTYVALSLYQSEHDGLPAPNLDLLRRDVDPIDLQSVDDPQAAPLGPDLDKRATFSCDAALQTLGCHSSTRISWSYRYDWREAGDPRVTSLDPRRGLLADPWPGALLRVTMDGAIVQKPRGESTFAGLFGQ